MMCNEETYTCPECGFELRVAMLDMDGTNLEEGYTCTNCDFECLEIEN